MMSLLSCRSQKRGSTEVRERGDVSSVSCQQRVIDLLPVLTEAASGYDAIQAKASLDTLDSDQDGEISVDDLSEEPVRIESPSPPPPPPSSDAVASTYPPVHQRPSSPDSKTNAVKTKPNGVQQCLDRILAMAAASSTGQAHKPAANTGLDPMPPALPPKTRRVKLSEAPKVPELSDRGDSDMDEENYCDGQGKVKKVGVACCRKPFTILYMSSISFVYEGIQENYRSGSLNKHTLLCQMFGSTNCLS